MTDLDHLHLLIQRRKSAGFSPVAAVLFSKSPLATPPAASLMGLSVAYDPQLDPRQVLFFEDPQQFTRYTSQIPAQ